MILQKVSPQQRREHSNKKIKNLGIICFEELPMLESSSEVKLKSLDEICKRAVASLLCVQLALDLSNEIKIEDVDDSQAQTYTEEERQIAQEITEQIFTFLKMYDWAVVENRLHPEKPIGELNPDVVWERRKGLEWLIREEDDWDMIPLHT